MPDRHFGRRELLLIAVLALVPRLLSLGSFSLWFDELLQTIQTRGSLTDTWRELQGDVHPPLDALVTWGVQRVTSAEPLRRLAPVVWGVLTVVLLAAWAGQRFGRSVGWGVAVLAALSPFHVRYSQELRPYSLALLLALATVWQSDRLLDEWSRRRLFCLAALVTAASMTLYLNGLVALPLAVMWLVAWRGGGPRAANAGRLVRSLPLLLLGPVLFLLAWKGSLMGLYGRAAGDSAASWSVARAAARWHFVTVGGHEREPFSIVAAWGLALLVAGLFVALRRGLPTAGRSWAVVLALCGGTLLSETVLKATNHWSSGRYSFFAWLFLVVLLVLGAEGLAQFFTRGRPSWARSLFLLFVGIQLLCQLPGLQRYYREGREDWRPIASLVASWGPAGRPVLASGDWSWLLLRHYLEPLPNGDFYIENLEGQTRRLAGLSWSGRRVGRCAVLVEASWPPLRRLHRYAPGARLVAEFPRSDVRIFQLPAGGDGPPCPDLVVAGEPRRGP